MNLKQAGWRGIPCVLFAVLFVLGVGQPPLAAAAPQAEAKNILQATGVKGGLIVHLGCGDGKLTAALRANDSYLVQGLDADATDVAKARAHLQSLGIYGPASIDRFDGKRLPYVDNLVNLVVAEDLGGVPPAEVTRVLRPHGVAYIKQGSGWKMTVKPRPAEIDEWTHYLHGPDNNAVSRDTVVAPPRRMQWVGSPRYARHHDNMSSVNALVTSGGRLFYIMDEAPRFSILLNPRWQLIARDAFNGVVLWKRPIPKWYFHLHGLKSGPAQLPRRLVAKDDRVYVTLGIDAALTALDAATGETVREYKDTAGTEEIILSDGILFAQINHAPSAGPPAKQKDGAAAADEAPRTLMAIEADSGKVLWREEFSLVRLTLAVDGERAVFLSGEQIVCLDPKSGKERWRSATVPRAAAYPVRSAPTLVLQGDVILFAGGELAANGNRSWDVDKSDTLTALSAKTGDVLWKAPHPLSGYASPEDVLVAKGVVWSGETTSGKAVGRVTGRDLRTGKVVSEFDPDVETYWFHHRCHRGKATVNYLLTSRAGIEFIDVANQHWNINHWVRGACLYGVMPANGLIYAPQHPCACYLESKTYGFNALAPEGEIRNPKSEIRNETARLERGPAYGAIRNEKLKIKNGEEWATYRHDGARSGRAGAAVPLELKKAWKAEIGGKVSAPVVTGGKVFVAAVDAHAVHALDARSGEKLWNFTAGGRVDSPPTVHQGLVLFGSADGCVYALRAADGVLAWRFRAAPTDRRLMSFEQLESVWPVHGSVLVHDDVLYCVAGRSMFLDGGLRLYRLAPQTGELLSMTALDGWKKEDGKTLQDHISQLDMPPALPDVLSCDGRRVYMRSQPFGLDGKRLPLGADAKPQAETARLANAHLFSPTGFLDDDWWHRTYWVYGDRFFSGYSGYPRAGKISPSGRILVFDEDNVYGFGRKPQYYKWTTPIEHHLFSAAKDPSTVKREKPAAKPAAQKGKKPARAGFAVAHHWTQDLPLFARAMILADGALFVAGPADLLDESKIGKNVTGEETQEQLRQYGEAFESGKGCVLWAVNAKDGKKQSELALDGQPVFDGMAAAYGRLFMSTTDGGVTCFAGE